MFLNGVDIGYKTNHNWWWDPNDPDHYRYADLDKDYPTEYFALAEPPRVKEFVQTVMDYYKKITGVRLRTIAEFGCGGGWYMNEFHKQGIGVNGYEGSIHGVNRCNKIQAWPTHVDFRKHILRGSSDDIILCTEVAEHIEMPFHGTLVSHLVDRSPLVWWSSEEPNTNQPHLHHPGEMPLEYWIRLFEFFGYGCHMLPDEIMASTENRGRCIFFNEKVYQL